MTTELLTLHRELKNPSHIESLFAHSADLVGFWREFHGRKSLLGMGSEKMMEQLFAKSKTPEFDWID